MKHARRLNNVQELTPEQAYNEYQLIQQKKSNFSSKERRVIVNYYNKVLKPIIEDQDEKSKK